MVMLKIHLLVRNLLMEFQHRNQKELTILSKQDIKMQLVNLSMKFNNLNTSLYKDNLWAIQLIENIICHKKLMKILNMDYLHRKINMMSSKQFIQVRICQKINISGKCTWNLILTMIQDNKRRDLMIGMLIQLILDLEK
jgi:hypothetical protein